MTYHFDNDRLTNPEIVRNFEPSQIIREAVLKRPQPVAVFTLQGNHEVVVRRGDDGLTATCDTCSLSQTAARAAVFAYQNGIRKMSFDGADLKRN